MAKPSIFSREYERRMKKRKLRIAFVIAIILLAFIAFYFKGEYKGLLNKVGILSGKKTVQSNKESQNSSVNQQSTKPLETVETKEKAFDLVLTDGTKVRAVYEEKQGVNIFKSIFTENATISFIANPAGTALVLNDSKAQSMWLIDGSGKVTDITNPGFRSYTKASVLKKRPSYVWCAAPKFVDDENIVYISQLPRISRIPQKYIWAVNIKSPSKHIYNRTLIGEDIKFGNITEGSLEVILGSIVKYIKVNNSAIEVVK